MAKCLVCSAKLFTKESKEKNLCLTCRSEYVPNTWPHPSSDELAFEAMRDREATQRFIYDSMGSKFLTY